MAVVRAQQLRHVDEPTGVAPGRCARSVGSPASPTSVAPAALVVALVLLLVIIVFLIVLAVHVLPLLVLLLVPAASVPAPALVAAASPAALPVAVLLAKDRAPQNVALAAATAATAARLPLSRHGFDHAVPAVGNVGPLLLNASPRRHGVALVVRTGRAHPRSCSTRAAAIFVVAFAPIVRRLSHVVLLHRYAHARAQPRARTGLAPLRARVHDRHAAHNGQAPGAGATIHLHALLAALGLQHPQRPPRLRASQQRPRGRRRRRRRVVEGGRRRCGRRRPLRATVRALRLHAPHGGHDVGLACARTRERGTASGDDQ